MASIVLSGALNEVIGVRGFLVSTSLVPDLEHSSHVHCVTIFP